MSTSKAKKKVTAKQYQDALAAFLTADTKACALAAKRDVEVNKLNDKYNPQFEELRLESEKQAAIIKDYCADNRSELFPGEAKSIDVNGAKIGFKLGSNKVELLVEEAPDKEEEKRLWDEALIKVKKHLPDYIRTVEEISKAKLIEDREQQPVIRGLVKCGLKISRDETFFIKPVKTKK